MFSNEEEQLFEQVFQVLSWLDPVTEKVASIEEIRASYIRIKNYTGETPTFDQLLCSNSQMSNAIFNKDITLLKKINE